MKRTAVNGVVFLLLAGFCFAGGCERHLPKMGTDPKMSERRVDAIWKEHQQAMESALAGEPHSIKEFEAACRFFTRLSGIEIRGNGSFFGWLPNQETAADYEKVKEWYAENKASLYWDEQSKAVQVRAVHTP